ncbi:hypothetical protein [Paracidovorax konjaci]|uniref:Uncharacterized protein n=1 Tax=Paracidovorax konjaci TaxID=32040 RepID=A0A1I1ZK62_9BURK|nr:hypothetical protein [Paracidovorax konjaci]SFE32096.1 hypothetical protein SAMN04489710_12910 [Paracidovorax konjaci]
MIRTIKILILASAGFYAFPSISANLAIDQKSIPQPAQCAQAELSQRSVPWDIPKNSETPLNSTVSPQYIEIPDIYWNKARAEKQHPKGDLAKSISQQSGVLAIIEESANRVTYFLQTDTEATRIMVTKWRFKLDNPQICIPDDSINTSAQGNASTIALAQSSVSEKNTPCLWKLDTIVKGETQYEFWIKEICHNGKPKKDHKTIIQLIQNNQSLSP